MHEERKYEKSNLNSNNNISGDKKRESEKVKQRLEKSYFANPSTKTNTQKSSKIERLIKLKKNQKPQYHHILQRKRKRERKKK